jgi:aminopeptidase N
MSFSVSTGRLLLIPLLLLLFSCKSLKKSDKTVQVADKEKKSVSTFKTSNGPYQPSRTRPVDLLHTKLEVSFDWKNQYLNGVAYLTFKPLFYPQKGLVLDAKGMDIHSVESVTPNAIPLKYSYNKEKLDITLDKVYQRNDTFLIRIKYTAKPNEIKKGGSDAITDDRGLYFINADGKDPQKPVQIWTQGETEANSCWFPTIDSPNEKTTQEMFITVDSAFNVLSNGELVYQKANKDGTNTYYWKQDLPHSPYLFMMAIGKYAIIEDKMTDTLFDWDDFKVNYYVEPQYGKYAKSIFGNTPEMIAFFSSLLKYKYPWDKYSQVVVRDFVSGAMENTSASVFMEALQSDDRELLDESWDPIIAHELFHHWFGDLVTAESWANLPLNESFANYSEYLWLNYKYGKDEADQHAETEEKQYFDEANHKQEPLIRFHFHNREEMFDRHSYNKGGRVLHTLRAVVGDSAFFQALNLYLKRNQFKPAEIHDLRLAFEEVTGTDMNWFFNQWFLASGHPNLKIESHYSNGMLGLTVEQQQDTLRTPVYRLPFKLDVWVNGMKNTFNLELTKAKQDFSLPCAAQPSLVHFDPDNEVLSKKSHEKTDEELIFQFKNSEGYFGRKDALVAYFDLSKAENQELAQAKFKTKEFESLLKGALNDRFWGIRDFALDQFSRYVIPNIENYIPDLERIASSDSKPAVRAQAIYLLSSYDNKRFVDLYYKGLDEKAYSVVGASLSSLLKEKDANIEKRIPEFESIDNINIIIPLANYFINAKDTSRFLWFKKNMQTSEDRRTYALLSYFSQYLAILPETEKNDGKQLLKKISETNKHEVIRNAANYYLQMLK